MLQNWSGEESTAAPQSLALGEGGRGRERDRERQERDRGREAQGPQFSNWTRYAPVPSFDGVNLALLSAAGVGLCHLPRIIRWGSPQPEEVGSKANPK
jgi:hypothetical protein